MYFPENMTLQYFFFDTYIGYFLQVIPIALGAGAGYCLYRRRKEPELPRGRLACSSLFVSYLAALLSLTLFSEWIGDLYFSLLHHTPLIWEPPCCTFEYHLIPTLWDSFGGEQLGNILLFLPFGILYPLFRPKSTWQGTILCGTITSLAIETIQPLVGRSFDSNDLLLNCAGVIGLAAVFAAFQALRKIHKTHSSQL